MDNFKIAYRNRAARSGYLSQIVSAADAGEAIAAVREQHGFVTVGRVSVQCRALTADGNPCQRFGPDVYCCAAHEPRCSSCGERLPESQWPEAGDHADYICAPCARVEDYPAARFSKGDRVVHTGTRDVGHVIKVIEPETIFPANEDRLYKVHFDKLSGKPGHPPIRMISVKLAEDQIEMAEPNGECPNCCAPVEFDHKAGRLDTTDDGRCHECGHALTN